MGEPASSQAMLRAGSASSACLVALALLAPGGVGMADPPRLRTIETTCVDDDATGYATFQSHNQKVISNRRGYFMAYLRRRNEAYTAQQWRLIQSQDGGHTWRTLHEETNATNPPCLETDDADNVYLIRPDWGNAEWAQNKSYLYRFLARDDYARPLVTEIPGSVHGKFALEIDLPRQRLYYFSANNTFHVIGLDGTVRRSIGLLAEGEHAATQYPSLHLDRDGTLYAAWTTQKKGVYLYWDIHVMKSPDGGVTWQKLDGTPLAPPIVCDDTGPTDRVSLNDEFDVHTWLSNFLAKAGKLHFFYESQLTPPRERYVRYDLRTGQPDVDLRPRFGGESLDFCRLDGFFAADPDDPAGPLFCVGNGPQASNRVACLASRDNGATWHDYALSESTFGVLYSITGCRRVTRDGQVIGAFTDTAAGGATERGAKVYFVKIAVTSGP
jgi:hypothetical protein